MEGLTNRQLSAYLSLRNEVGRMPYMELLKFNQELTELHKELIGNLDGGSPRVTLRGIELDGKLLSEIQLELNEHMAGIEDTVATNVDAQVAEAEAEEDTRPIYEQELERINHELSLDPNNLDLQAQHTMWSRTKSNTETLISDHAQQEADQAASDLEAQNAMRVTLGQSPDDDAA